MIRQAKKIAHEILKRTRGPAQVYITGKKGALVRFANNGVYQNGFQDAFNYTLRAETKEGPCFVESNDCSDAGIERAVKEVENLCPSPQPSPRKRGEGKSYARKKYFPSPSGRGQGEGVSEVKEWFPLNTGKIPEMAAAAIGRALKLIRSEQASANGYFSAYERLFYLADSSGLELAHPATAVRFGVTVNKGTGKGYFSYFHPDPRRLSVEKVVNEAMDLAKDASSAEISLPTGEYECIFSPRAFLEFLEPVRRHFDAQLTKDGKSVFSGHLREKIFSKSFTLSEDVTHPLQCGVPFDAEGAPKTKAILVCDGVLNQLLAEGHSTRGIMGDPFYPQNLVVANGGLSFRDMIGRVQRGVIINKIWYHTLVREKTMEVTGLATAGCLFIENGRIKGRVVHLRFHDSIFHVLQNVTGTSKEQILLKDGEMGAALLPYVWVSRLRVV